MVGKVGVCDSDEVGGVDGLAEVAGALGVVEDGGADDVGGGGAELTTAPTLEGGANCATGAPASA